MKPARLMTNRIGSTIATAVLAALAVNCRTAAQDPFAAFKDNVYQDIAEIVPTPHVNWAPVLPGGTLRVLVIAPAWAQRESVELMQRFDVACVPLMTLTHKKLAGITYGPVQYMTPTAVAQRFDRKLKETFDVILIGGIDWRILHIEHRYEILRKVFNEGTGLVYIAPPDDRELKELTSRNPDSLPENLVAGIPWDILPELKDKEAASTISTGRFGNGRWITLQYRTMSTNQALTPAPAAPPQKPWTYEYYQCLLARALLLAAGRNLPLILRGNPAAELTETSLPAQQTISVTSDENIQGVAVETWLHDLENNRRLNTRMLTGRSLPKGTSEFPVPVQHAPAGNYLVCIRITHQNTTLGWAAWPLDVRTDENIATLEIDRPAVEIGKDLTGRISLAKAARTNTRLRVTLSDRSGRILAQREYDATPTVPFNLATANAVGGGIHNLSAELLDNEQRVRSRKVIPATLKPHGTPAFHLSIWEESQTDYISRLWYDRFHDLGVNAIFYTVGRKDAPAAAPLVAEAGLFGAPMTAAYSPHVETNDGLPFHNPCLHDTDFVAQLARKNREIAQTWSSCPVLHYGDGSDKHMHGVCFCADTLDALRTELRRRYGTVDALNSAWNAAFARWEDVVPDTLEQARTNGTFRSWLEHVQFMETAYAESYARTRDALQAVDPGALNGPDGYGRLNSRDGSDWEKLFPNLGFYNLYTYQDPPQLEITRSIATDCPNVKLRSIYYGSYDGQFGNDAFMRRIPWFALLHNYNGLFWWNANGKTTYPASCGRLAGPDFRATRSYMISRNEIDAVRNGPAQLLACAKREHSGIAILYDQLIVHAHTALSHPSHLVKAYTDWQAAIEDLALQYNYVTPRLVADGVLAKQKYRVLILPRALALADQTIEHIRRFRDTGGLVLADYPPGTHDEHLAEAGNRRRFTDAFRDVDTLNAISDCRSVIVGDLLADYRRNRYDARGAKARTELWRMLQQAGVTPPVSLKTETQESGAPPPHWRPGLEVVAYRDGTVRYIGVLNHGDAMTGTLLFPKKLWLTDLRMAHPLGKTREIPFAIQPGQCMLVAALQHSPGTLLVTAADPKQGGPAVQLTVEEKDSPATRACRISVRDPQRRTRPEYAGITLLIAGNTARRRIPIALNDPPGAWHITVTDLLTGDKNELALNYP